MYIEDIPLRKFGHRETTTGVPRKSNPFKTTGERPRVRKAYAVKSKLMGTWSTARTVTYERVE